MKVHLDRRRHYNGWLHCATHGVETEEQHLRAFPRLAHVVLRNSTAVESQWFQALFESVQNNFDSLVLGELRTHGYRSVLREVFLPFDDAVVLAFFFEDDLTAVVFFLALGAGG